MRAGEGIVFVIELPEPNEGRRVDKRILIRPEGLTEDQVLEALRGRGLGVMGTDSDIRVTTQELFGLEEYLARHPKKEPEE